MSLLPLGLVGIFQITPALFYLCVTPNGACQSGGGERMQAPWSGSGVWTGDARPTLLGPCLPAPGSRRQLLVHVLLCFSVASAFASLPVRALAVPVAANEPLTVERLGFFRRDPRVPSSVSVASLCCV